MDIVREFIAYFTFHGPALVGVVLMAVAFAESVVRITPTKKDDGFVERVGKWIRSALDTLGSIFPNLKKGGGSHPPLKVKKDV